MANYKLIKCTINGRNYEKHIDVRASLSDVLRNEFSILSVKRGCNVGECGTCCVLVNDVTINSCIYLGIWADGKDIVTQEGLMSKSGELHPVQQAFIDYGAIQCGYCTPGFLMSAYELYQMAIKQDCKFSDEQIKTALSGHICRCTGYVNILKAVKSCLADIGALL